MRTETTQYYTIDEIKVLALEEAKIFNKFLKTKLVEWNIHNFKYGLSTQCFYGRVFNEAFSDEAVEFKLKHKFKFFKQEKTMEGDYRLQLSHKDEIGKNAATALEILTMENEPYGKALNMAMRLNFKFTPEQIIELNLL